MTNQTGGNMQMLSVTVTNSNDPSCQRLKLTKEFMIEDIDRPEPFIRECIKYTEDAFREIFPRGMSYTLPYTEASVIEVVEVTDSDDETVMRLLREAYASGQLRGTLIGDKLRDFFGVNYTDPSIDTAPETPLLSESLGGHKL
jgi:hypothetical protein